MQSVNATRTHDEVRLPVTSEPVP